MRIVGSALVNRFYVSDGWTCEKVAQLLNVQNEEYVTPRYWREKSAGIPEDKNEPVVYYAVYDTESRIPSEVGFVREEVEKHEYDPFSRCACDQKFEQKNRMAP